jgi:hypothetical protein
MSVRKFVYKATSAIFAAAILAGVPGCAVKEDPAPITTPTPEDETPSPTFTVEPTSTPEPTPTATTEPTPSATPEYKVRFTSIEDLYDDEKVEQVAEEFLKSIQDATFLINKNIDVPTLAEFIRVYYSVPTKDKKNLNPDYYSDAILCLFGIKQEEICEVYKIKKGLGEYIENPNFLDWTIITIENSPEEELNGETAEYLNDFYINGASAFSNTQKLYNTTYDMYMQKCAELNAIPYAGAKYFAWYAYCELACDISDLDPSGPFPSGNTAMDFMLPIVYYDMAFQKQTTLDSWTQCEANMGLKKSK